MKAHRPYSYLVYAARFSKTSVLYAISMLAFLAYEESERSKFGSLAMGKRYTLLDGKRPIRGYVNLVQPWLMDLFYALVTCWLPYATPSARPIRFAEALYLVDLYNGEHGWDQDRVPYSELSETIMLRVYGMLGEQTRMQTPHLFLDDFARDDYILSEIAPCVPTKDIPSFDYYEEFANEVHCTPHEHAALCFLTYVLFASADSKTPGILSENVSALRDGNGALTNADVRTFLKRYAGTLEEAEKDEVGRQYFYQKPWLQFGQQYLAVNPFCIMNLFSSGNYWVVRNAYKERGSQKFTNSFGEWFECYFKEILEYCFAPSQFERIKEDNVEKRADWILRLGDKTFLIEQKSATLRLGAKQTMPDIDQIKDYMVNTWGKAVEQLNKTACDFGLKDPIKIILVYDEYLNTQSLDQLFKMKPSLVNNRDIWLVSISEFEKLAMLYKTSESDFWDVIEKKIHLEKTASKDGRQLSLLLREKRIFTNTYLEATGISAHLDRVFEILKTSCTPSPDPV